MDKQNILVISYFFAPNSIVGAKRISYLTHYLKEYFNFYIITNELSENDSEDINLKYSGKIYNVKEFPKFYSSNKKLIYRSYNKIFRKIAPIDRFSGWIIPAFLKGIKLIKKEKIEKIFVTGPPFSHFIIGYLLSKLYRIPLLLDYRDPWLLNHGKTKTEKIIINQAIKIIMNTEQAKIGYLNSDLAVNIKNKIYCVSNAYLDVSDIQTFDWKNEKVIFYAGNYYGKRRLVYLFEPLIKLMEENPHLNKQLYIHTFGNLLDEDKKAAKKANLESRIIQHAPVEHKEIIKFMKGADILYLPQVTFGDYAIPYKFFDYISAKKPILAITPSNTATESIIKELNCGEVAAPDKPDEIYQALKNILFNNKKYEFSSADYSWTAVSKKYNQILGA